MTAKKAPPAKKAGVARAKRDFLDELIDRREARSPGFAARVEQRAKKAPPAKKQAPLADKTYGVWDRKGRRGPFQTDMTLEGVAAYILGATMGRWAPDSLRDLQVREIPSGRPLRHTVQDLIDLSELLDLSPDRPRMEAALRQWAVTHPAMPMMKTRPAKKAGPSQERADRRLYLRYRNDPERQEVAPVLVRLAREGETPAKKAQPAKAEARLTRDEFFLTAPQAAKRLGVTTAELSRMIERREIGAIHPAAGTRVPLPAIEAYQRRTAKKKAAAGEDDNRGQA